MLINFTQYYGLDWCVWDIFWLFMTNNKKTSYSDIDSFTKTIDVYKNELKIFCEFEIDIIS